MTKRVAMDDEDLNKRVSELLAAVSSKRKRGRPATGFAKALKYADQYYEFIRSGKSRWRAIVEVAEENHKTPQHISTCRKMVEETDSREYYPEDKYWPEDDCADKGAR
jgi:hypothetical protein